MKVREFVLKKIKPLDFSVKRILAACVLVSVAWGCGGRLPQSVMTKQPQDDLLTCQEIENEFEQITVKISDLYLEGKTERKKNKFFEVLSYIVPPATLFKDFRKAERVEINSLRKRHNYLLSISQKKECNGNRQFIPHKQHCKDFYTLDCFLPGGNDE
jgi:hypothetical protein